MVPQLLHPQPHPRLHRTKRLSGALGDFRLAQPRVIPHPQSLSLLRWQRGQCRKHHAPALCGLGVDRRIAVRRELKDVILGIALQRFLALPPHRAHAVERSAACNREQPGLYRAARCVVPLRLTPCLPEGLLDHVIHIACEPYDSLNHRMNQRVPPVVKGAERVLVAIAHAAKQRRVVCGAPLTGDEDYAARFGVRRPVSLWIHTGLNVRWRFAPRQTRGSACSSQALSGLESSSPVTSAMPHHPASSIMRLSMRRPNPAGLMFLALLASHRAPANTSPPPAAVPVSEGTVTAIILAPNNTPPTYPPLSPARARRLAVKTVAERKTTDHTRSNTRTADH